MLNVTERTGAKQFMYIQDENIQILQISGTYKKTVATTFDCRWKNMES
jgi:hypothetical protein